MLEFAFATYEVFGLDVRLELSTRPEKRIGSDELWDRSEAALRAALERQGLEYDRQRGRRRVLRRQDRHAHDRLARPLLAAGHRASSTTTSPERFGLIYTGADNAEHRPVMIHRALMGSYERFIGILLEHFGGRAAGVAEPGAGDRAADRRPPHRVRPRSWSPGCPRPGVRAELDDRTESVGRKIRDAELRKIPYMLVVGDREAGAGRGQRARAPRRRHRGRRRSQAFAQRVAGTRRKVALDG